MSTRDDLIAIAENDERVRAAVSRDGPSVRSVAAAVIDALGVEPCLYADDGSAARWCGRPVFRLRGLERK